MSATISDHQARVYEYARSLQGKWFTVQQLATATNVRAASAKRHVSRFETLGIFERVRLSPSHVFRLSEHAADRCPHMTARLEEAVPIIVERRRELLRRETQYMQAVSSTQAETSGGGEATTTDRALRGKQVARPSEVAVPKASKKGHKPRKADQIMAMLERSEGASLEEIADTFDIKTHSARAVISVESRKRGVKVVLADGRYRISGGQA